MHLTWKEWFYLSCASPRVIFILTWRFPIVRLPWNGPSFGVTGHAVQSCSFLVLTLQTLVLLLDIFIHRGYCWALPMEPNLLFFSNNKLHLWHSNSITPLYLHTQKSWLNMARRKRVLSLSLGFDIYHCSSIDFKMAIFWRLSDTVY